MEPLNRLCNPTIVLKRMKKKNVYLYNFKITKKKKKINLLAKSLNIDSIVIVRRSSVFTACKIKQYLFYLSLYKSYTYTYIYDSYEERQTCNCFSQHYKNNNNNKRTIILNYKMLIKHN